MATYVIANVRQARILATYYGMSVPEGRGRFPIQRLAEIATDHGDRVDLARYESGSDKTSVGSARYRVTALVNGKRNAVVPSETEITVSEVREWAKHHGRGRVSHKEIAQAAMAAHDWDPHTTTVVSVDSI